MTEVKKKTTAARALFDRYGELWFDLCHSLIRDPDLAVHAFKLVLKSAKGIRKIEFEDLERPWAISLAMESIQRIAEQVPPPVNVSESELTGSKPTPEDRLRRFNHYFNKLGFTDRLLLVLVDKHQIPLEEVAAVMTMPLSTTKMKRIHALRALEDRIWV